MVDAAAFGGGVGFFGGHGVVEERGGSGWEAVRTGEDGRKGRRRWREDVRMRDCGQFQSKSPSLKLEGQGEGNETES